MGSGAQSGAVDTVAVIETPEHVRFEYPLAGPVRRMLAYVIDFALRAVIVSILYAFVTLGGVAGGQGLAGVSSGVLFVAVFVLEWGYFILSETLMDGRSIGKRALSLRVVTNAGRPLSFGDSVLRNLLRAADFLPFFYAIGFVMMARDREFRRLGDVAAGTLVVHEERETPFSSISLPTPTPNELESLPDNPDLSSSELESIALFLQNAGNVSEAREQELAEMVAPVFAKRFGVAYQDPSRFLAALFWRATKRGHAEPR